MKKITLLLLISFSGFSQSIIKNKIDEFTKVRYIETNITKEKRLKEIDNISQDKGSVYFNLSYIESEKLSIFLFNILLYSNYDLGCFSKYDGKIIFLLENGKTIEGKQFSDTSCEKTGNTIKYTLATSSDSISTQFENFDILSKEKISKIRIYGSKFFQDFIIKEDAKEYIKGHFLILKDEINKLPTK
ncbi:hypothetical protein [Flavobacterium sp. WC2509]|uniref:hypothetical protein n=1 Tax=Flavobacterium sp. WC2509 TaxID=3461406 RepID=UPI004044F38D